MIFSEKILSFTFLLIITFSASAQVKVENKSELSVKQIMQWPHLWIGSSPENISWSETGDCIYFEWNPEKNNFPSLYKYTIENEKIEKVSLDEKKSLPNHWESVYSKDFTKKLYSKNGDLFLLDIKNKKTFQITNTINYEINPSFSANEKLVYFQTENNLFSWNTMNGQITQLTNISSAENRKNTSRSEQEEWLYNAQMREFEVLADRKRKSEEQKLLRESEKPNRPKEIYTDGKRLSNLNISPNGKIITFSLNSSVEGKSTEMPNYVTESGYTEMVSTRKKVGEVRETALLMIYNIEKDTVMEVKTDNLLGLNDKPDYFKNYPELLEKDYTGKLKYISEAIWNKAGDYAVFESRSQDNKHRWIFTVDFENGEAKVLEHQQDNAWINGPGIGYWHGNIGWMPNQREIWFQSEESGFSHLYSVNIENRKKKALTSGHFEIENPIISKDKKSWYFTANKVHPGEKHFYSMPIQGGKITKITNMKGNSQVVLSPKETKLAFLYSSSNAPWELYISDNKINATAKQLTNSTTDEFNAYSWRKPEIVTFKARDGREVYARLYQPNTAIKNKAAVVFVHGAGYLQNAHKWWSSYFREYMFHNMLVDNGYTVLDMDYAGSAGYGRNWRTLIYRHMGGKDLTDQADGANFLIENYGIAKDKIGIYGGSYGGFISIFAMLKENKTFTSAAAIRSVTDWAHYNHAYTSNILNTPVLDSLAFRRSSPIYFADGLKNNLLILHGMLDSNVHFQDVVMLQQRFIELGKENWEFVPYPMEDHGFVEPSSWTNEYQRIFKLFQTTIGK